MESIHSVVQENLIGCRSWCLTETIIIFCMCLTKCLTRLKVGLTCSDPSTSSSSRDPVFIYTSYMQSSEDRSHVRCFVVRHSHAGSVWCSHSKILPSNVLVVTCRFAFLALAGSELATIGLTARFDRPFCPCSVQNRRHCRCLSGNLSDGRPFSRVPLASYERQTRPI